MRRPVWITGLVLIATFGFAGCAGPQGSALPEATSPNIEIGPVYELLKVRTLSDKVRVVCDNSGMAHVFIASAKLKSLNYVVVGHEGVVRREVVMQSVSPSAIDAAFDKTGGLHLLIDDKHYVRSGKEWQPQQRTPWQQAGIKPADCRFVQGGDDLIWGFLVNGADLKSPGRWNLYGFGGYGGGVIWPWYSRGSRLVVVPETDSYATWTVFDVNSSKDVVNWQAAANLQGMVYAIYDAAISVIAYVAEPRYAQFVNTSRDTEGENVPAEQRRIKKVSSQLIKGPYDRRGFGSQIRIAAEPNADCALLVKAHTGSWLIRDGQCNQLITMPIKTFWEPRLASAGGSRFHAVVIGPARNQWTGKHAPVLYLEFSEGKWSAPVEVGVADVSSFWASIWEAIEIGCVGPEALVVWPTEDGIAGRWVRTKRQEGGI